MENRHPNSFGKKSARSGDRNDIENEGLERGRKKFKNGNVSTNNNSNNNYNMTGHMHGSASADILAYQRQGMVMEQKRAWFNSLGIVNSIDPLTQMPLEALKPVALIVNEDTGELFGFDLFSLYHLCLKKGKLWIKTFKGRFKLEEAESRSLIMEYAGYYGMV